MFRSPLVSARRFSRFGALGFAATIALVGALGLVGGGASVAAAESTASISGTVTAASTGLPLANISVSLDLPGGTYVQFGTTDADGNYSFTGLAATPYVINFAPGYGDNYVQQWWNNKPTLASATPISVSAAQAVTGINATLADGATVTGKVETGSAPDASSTVIIEDAAGNIYNSTMTDDNGNYSVSQLPAGQFTAAFAPSFTVTDPTQWWNDQSSLAAADFFTTVAGQTTSDIDATFEPTTSGSVSGTVYDSSAPGQPLAFAAVQALTPDGSYAGSASTDSNGNYTMGGLVPGTYTLEFLPGFSAPTLAPQYWQAEPSLASADFFAISAGDALTGYDAHLIVGGTISGTVLDGTTGNAPLPGVGVTIYQNGSLVPTSSFPQTDADGNYTLSGLAAGSYDVEFQAQYPSDDSPQWWSNASSEAGATHVSVADGATTTGINATLHAGGTISGVVTGKTANGTIFPAGNAQLILYAADGSVVSDGYMTDGDGNYSLTNLTPGTYKLLINPQDDTTDFVPQWWKHKTTEATATPIVLKAGQVRSDISPVLASTTLKAVTPRISGAAKVGSTLTAKAGTWRPGKVTLTYQWSRGNVPIDGATAATYVLTNADANSAITVTVTGSEPGYTTDSVTSAATRAVTGGILSTGRPSIEGTAAVGQVLSASPGTWGPGAVDLTYKWYRSSVRIGGATSSTYTLVHADAGKTVTVKVTGAETGFTAATVASAPTAVVH